MSSDYSNSTRVTRSTGEFTDRADNQKNSASNRVGGHDYTINPNQTETLKKAKNVFTSILKDVFRSVKDAVRNKATTIKVSKDFEKAKSVKVRLPYPSKLKLKADDISLKSASGEKLRGLLNQPYGLVGLKQALKNDKAIENLHFLLSLKNLSNLVDTGKHEEADRVLGQIKDLFFGKDAAIPINIPGKYVQSFISEGDSVGSKSFKENLRGLQEHIEKMIGDQGKTIDDAIEIATDKQKAAQERSDYVNHAIDEFIF